MFKFANFTLFIRSNPKKSINYIVENYNTNDNKILLEANLEALKAAKDSTVKSIDELSSNLDSITSNITNNEPLNNDKSALLDPSKLVLKLNNAIQANVVNNHDLHALYNTANLSKQIYKSLLDIKNEYQSEFNNLLRSTPIPVDSITPVNTANYQSTDDPQYKLALQEYKNLKQEREDALSKYYTIAKNIVTKFKDAFVNIIDSVSDNDSNQSTINNTDAESTFSTVKGKGADNRDHLYGTSHGANIGGNTIMRLEGDKTFIGNLKKLASSDTVDSNTEKNIKASISDALNSAIVQLNTVSKTPGYTMGAKPTVSKQAGKKRKPREYESDKEKAVNPFYDVSSFQASDENIILEDKVVLDKNQLFTLDILSRLLKDKTINYLGDGTLYRRGDNNEIEYIDKAKLEELLNSIKATEDEATLLKDLPELIINPNDKKSIVFNKAEFDAAEEAEFALRNKDLYNTNKYDVPERITYSDKINDKDKTKPVYKKLDSIVDYVYHWIKTNINSIVSSDGSIKWTALIPIINDIVDKYDVEIDEIINTAKQPLKGNRETSTPHTSQFDAEAILRPTKFDKIDIVNKFDEQIIQYQDMNELYNELSDDQKRKFVEHIEMLDEAEINNDIHTLCYLLLIAEKFNASSNAIKNLVTLVNSVSEIHDWDEEQILANSKNLFVLANKFDTSIIDKLINYVNTAFDNLSITKRAQTSKFKLLVDSAKAVLNKTLDLDAVISDNQPTSISQSAAPEPAVMPAADKEPEEAPKPKEDDVLSALGF